jgi:hypothetical protein
MEDSRIRVSLAVATLTIAGLAGSLSRCGTGNSHSGEVPPTETPVPAPLVNPCQTASSQIDLDTKGESTCIQTSVSGLGGAVVVWKAPAGYYPWIRFEDPLLTAPTIKDNMASWAPPAGSTTKLYAFKVNIVKTATPTPAPMTVTPTPQTFGRIIIDK